MIFLLEAVRGFIHQRTVRAFCVVENYIVIRIIVWLAGFGKRLDNLVQN
jgi:hypothetical protein